MLTIIYSLTDTITSRASCDAKNGSTPTFLLQLFLVSCYVAPPGSWLRRELLAALQLTRCLHRLLKMRMARGDSKALSQNQPKLSCPLDMILVMKTVITMINDHACQLWYNVTKKLKLSPRPRHAWQWTTWNRLLSRHKGKSATTNTDEFWSYCKRPLNPPLFWRQKLSLQASLLKYNDEEMWFNGFKVYQSLGPTIAALSLISPGSQATQTHHHPIVHSLELFSRAFESPKVDFSFRSYEHLKRLFTFVIIFLSVT